MLPDRDTPDRQAIAQGRNTERVDIVIRGRSRMLGVSRGRCACRLRFAYRGSLMTHAAHSPGYRFDSCAASACAPAVSFAMTAALRIPHQAQGAAGTYAKHARESHVQTAESKARKHAVSAATALTSAGHVQRTEGPAAMTVLRRHGSRKMAAARRVPGPGDIPAGPADAAIDFTVILPEAPCGLKGCLDACSARPPGTSEPGSGVSLFAYPGLLPRHGRRRREYASKSRRQIIGLSRTFRSRAKPGEPPPEEGRQQLTPGFLCSSYAARHNSRLHRFRPDLCSRHNPQNEAHGPAAQAPANLPKVQPAVQARNSKSASVRVDTDTPCKVTVPPLLPSP